MPSDDGIILTVKNNFDELKTSQFFELTNMFYEKEATLIVCDDKKYSRLCSLVQEDTQQHKPLSLYEAGLAVKNNLTNEQVKIFKTLIDSETKSYEAINFVIDNDKVKKYNEYTSFEKPIFTRGLTSQEAYFSINKNFSEEQIQELINIKNINPDLDFDYIAILLDFIDYKNKTDITQLNSIEKRNLLKLLVKNNASLFNTTVSTSIYPLVPKNQEEYCTLLPVLTNAIGINTKPISEEEKIQFFDTLNGLLKNICASNDLDIYLNSIYQVIPEIKAADIVEAIQVLKIMVINPKFLSLSQEDKNILTIATLLKDISENPLESSFDAFYIMQRFNLPEDMQLKIYELIKTSNWFEKLSKVKNGEVNKIAQDIAFETRHSNTFELSKILCEADLSLYSPEQRKEMKILADIIDSYLKKLQETQIFLPQTIIPKASQIKNGEVLSKDGISNVIFQINKTDKPLSSYGFQEGTTLENWQGLVHGLDTEQQLQIFTTFSLIDSEALLSSSYITPREYRGFRKQGLILDVNPNDIHAGYFKDFGSGFKKDIDTLKQHYLFPEKKQNTIWGGNRSQYRTYFPNLIKRKLDYYDSDYLRTIREIQDCKSITDVEEKNKKFAKTILEIFDNIHFGERKYNRQYNEILISRPKIQGVFSYGQKYEDIPLFLRKFAQDNDLPIIMFGDYK